MYLTYVLALAPWFSLHLLLAPALVTSSLSSKEKRLVSTNATSVYSPQPNDLHPTFEQNVNEGISKVVGNDRFRNAQLCKVEAVFNDRGASRDLDKLTSLTLIFHLNVQALVSIQTTATWGEWYSPVTTCGAALDLPSFDLSDLRMTITDAVYWLTATGYRGQWTGVVIRKAKIAPFSRVSQLYYIFNMCPEPTQPKYRVLIGTVAGIFSIHGWDPISSQQGDYHC